jgi:hypothetical protein
VNRAPLIQAANKNMASSSSSTDFLKSDLDDQQFWKACIGLDLANRTVLEAEILIWRIVQQKSALSRAELNTAEPHCITI